MTVKITLDRAAVRRVPADLVTPLVAKVGVRVLRGAQSMAPRKTGDLRDGIKGKLRITGTSVVYTVTGNDQKTMLLHQGAKRHAIVAKRGGPMLRFYWPKVGRVVTFHSVNHPGFGGRKFLTSPLILHGARNGFHVTITVGGLRGTISP